jgi:hypothetical protein
MVLAAQGVIDYRTLLFCNVGDDSEHPATLAYVHDVAAPYAAAHHLDLIELHRTRRDGTTETLFGRLTKPGSRSLPIPVRMSNGAPGTRSCTSDFKIRVIGKWVKAHGATVDTPATIAIGISLDEIHRANARRVDPWERITYPLVGYGDGPPLKLTRADCAHLIAAAGLPVPPKSACWFCPFHRPSTWADMRRTDPDLFDRAATLEALLIERRATLDKDPVYLTRFNMPLGDAIGGRQLALFEDSDDGSCDSGYCMT